MSLLIVQSLAGRDPARVLAIRRQALVEARRQGFEAPEVLEWPGAIAWWFATPGGAAGSGALVRRQHGFAACVGTPCRDGQGAADVLQRWLDGSHDDGAAAIDDVEGSFAALVVHGGRASLFVDALGLQKLYRNEPAGILSTSFLVCRAVVRSPTLDRQRALEYVLLGAVHADATPVREVTSLDPDVVLDPADGRELRVRRPSDWQLACPYASRADAVADLGERLAVSFGGIARAFGGRVSSALSGGFDSRLILAGFQRAGTVPRLFVYGRENDEDVSIARVVAERLGLALVHTDKQRLAATLAALTPAGAIASMRFFDGLPPDGVFDRGADRLTRLQAVADGHVALNGGGGEIFRNFFYLGRRGRSAADIARAFYTGFDVAVFRRPGDRTEFLERVSGELARVLGVPDGSAATRLARSHVELAYPLFRLRYWMGRNNSVAARLGGFMTPLVSPALVRIAASLPMAWKNYGRLEAELIARLSPRCAEGPSAYGFSFATGPDARYRLAMQGTMWRPPALRQYSATVQRWLGRARPVVPASEWLDAFDGPVDADWIDPARFTDPGQWNRLLSLLLVMRGASFGTADAAPSHPDDRIALA